MASQQKNMHNQKKNEWKDALVAKANANNTRIENKKNININH